MQFNASSLKETNYICMHFNFFKCFNYEKVILPISRFFVFDFQLLRRFDLSFILFMLLFLNINFISRSNLGIKTPLIELAQHCNIIFS